MTCDNASSNGVQVAALYGLENSFDETNHVRCFNHSIQLSGKALIKPFNAGMGKAASDVEDCTDDVPSLEEFDYDDDDVDGDDDAGPLEDTNEDDVDGESDILSEEEHMSMLADTSAVRETVTKVTLGFFFFDIADLYPTASTTFLRNNSFDHHRPSSMATILRCSWYENEVDPSGCRHALELYS